ncbi:YlcI/YnfO family protein [Escherichia coli]
MSSKNRTRRTTTRNIRFPNHIIEQINIALEHKGSGNFSAWVIEINTTNGWPGFIARPASL